MLNVPRLKAELAGRSLPMWRLAVQLGFHQSTFSEYVRGGKTAPEGFAQKVEKALGLKRGTLRAPSPAPRARSRKASGGK